MERSIIQLAGKTLVVSIPRQWARQRHINKGSKVALTETPAGILITTRGTKAPSTTNIDVSNLHTSLIWHAVTGAYISGATNIQITHTNTTTTHRRENRPITVNAYLAQLTDTLAGMDICSSEPKHTTIHEIAPPQPDELHHSLTRAFHTVTTLAREILTNPSGHPTDQDLLTSYENQTNKLTLKILRLLNTSHLPIPIITATTTTALALEDTADALTALARAKQQKHTQTYKTTATKTLRLIETLNTLWNNPTHNALAASYALHAEIDTNADDRTDALIAQLNRISRNAMQILHATLSNPHTHEQHHAPHHTLAGTTNR